MSLGAAVILTNLSDWKDIFGSYYLYFRSLLDKRVSKWMSGRFENRNNNKKNHDVRFWVECVCVRALEWDIASK